MNRYEMIDSETGEIIEFSKDEWNAIKEDELRDLIESFKDYPDLKEIFG